MSAIGNARTGMKLDDVNRKLDAIMAYLKLEDKAPEVAAAHEFEVKHDADDETAGVKQVRPEQVEVPPAVLDMPKSNVKISDKPMEGGRANGERPHKTGKMAVSPSQETRTRVEGEKREEATAKIEEAKAEPAKEEVK